MKNMPFRNKSEQPLRIEGKYVVLHEIQSMFFEDIVRWRNNPKLNKYLNQSEKLTVQSEREWYENVYCLDQTQGILIMVDKENQVPFGTIGWTDYDGEKRCLIEGRVLRALSEYRQTKPYLEVYKLIGDFLYQYVDMMYAHVVIDNIASIKLHERIGFKRNEGVIAYPQELTKLGMKQMEFVRSKHDFMLVRNFWE